MVLPVPDLTNAQISCVLAGRCGLVVLVEGFQVQHIIMWHGGMVRADQVAMNHGQGLGFGMSTIREFQRGSTRKTSLRPVALVTACRLCSLAPR